MIPQQQTLSLFPPMDAGAVIEPPYRYRLWRVWDPERPHVTFVMLNPSTANAHEDDPTLRRCLGFACAWGYGALTIVNLFAYQSPSPQVLSTVADPVGPDNDRHLLEATRQTDHLIVAWGSLGHLYDRDRVVCEMLVSQGATLYCLGLTKEGQPRHPLYLTHTTARHPFPVRSSGKEAQDERACPLY